MIALANGAQVLRACLTTDNDGRYQRGVVLAEMHYNPSQTEYVTWRVARLAPATDEQFHCTRCGDPCDAQGLGTTPDEGAYCGETDSFHEPNRDESMWEAESGNYHTNNLAAAIADYDHRCGHASDTES
jgi:hypothetical protein